MPHITETTTTAALAAGILAPGARFTHRFWDADAAPHAYLGSFHTADTVTAHADGSATVTYAWYTEAGQRRTQTLAYSAADVIALAAMTPLGDSGMDTYEHHDDRLILDAGHMDAHPGTMHRVWDVYAADGKQIAQGVTVADGRTLLNA
ncbi:hypothetical protein [Streptomyces sp. NPDC088752]|uniref:hypothetical protein n=1 Tax=Streptomyces sp. NPDC088752 TaxID=3154963 RepID=UPI0034447FE9